MNRESSACLSCLRIVRKRQEALLCDGCNLWQHRVCGTVQLSLGQFESTRLSQARNDAADVDVGNVSMDTASSTDEFYYPDATYALQNTTDVEFTLPPLQAPRVVQEDSIEDVTPQPNASETEDNVKSTIWRCSVRNTNIACKATVKQVGNTFITGAHSHLHPPAPGGAVAARICKTIKDEAKDNIFRPASQIVTAVVNKHLGAVPCPNLPGMDYLARNGNYARQKARPRDPVDLDFSMQEQHIADGFLQRDIHIDGQRHILLATEKQLSLLQNAKRWYADGTFKVVREPFVQLWSIHAFVRDGDNMKQVPLLFCMMSRRRTNDYVAVLQAILEVLPGTPAVAEIVMDFERAAWRAADRVMPDIRCQGCAFHWGQAVWRKAQELGLRRVYLEDNATFMYVRKLMALPLLPAEHISPVFAVLERKARAEPLEALVAYIKETWITSRMWPPTSWSVFGQSVRTNNDVEGWHHGFNTKAKQMPFYQLTSQLYEEAAQIELTLRLVSEGKLRRHQKKTFRHLQGKVAMQWDLYRSGEKTAMQCLKTFGRLYGPVMR
ncbi:hypothetical protein LSAT2_028071 [Lamellibrachia satsuma]|nr:hypothetical protein LSAT2_028071 [Lamellibrachia satsuma]